MTQPLAFQVPTVSRAASGSFSVHSSRTFVKRMASPSRSIA